MTFFDFILVFATVFPVAAFFWDLLNQKTKDNMAKISSLTATLAVIEAQLTKDKAEVSAKLTALTDEIAKLQQIIADTDAEIPPDAQASLERIAVLGKEIDDLNPDAPAPSGTGAGAPDPTTPAGQQ